jgi:ABC-2 type transport system permease protein
MIADTLTIARKEWRELFVPGGHLAGGAWSEGLTIVGALGIFIALTSGRAWVTSEMPLYWLWLPLLQMMGTIAESVAGERERRTLETLLASRVSDRAILFGKLFAALCYGWSLTLLSVLVGALTVSLAYGQGQLLFYPVSIAVSILGLALFGGLSVGLAGVLISIRSPTVRQAYQRLSLMLILVSLPVFSLQYLSSDWRSQLLPTEENWLLFALAACSVLVLMDALLLAVCLGQFRRPKLMASQ